MLMNYRRPYALNEDKAPISLASFSLPLYKQKPFSHARDRTTKGFFHVRRLRLFFSKME